MIHTTHNSTSCSLSRWISSLTSWRGGSLILRYPAPFHTIKRVIQDILVSRYRWHDHGYSLSAAAYHWALLVESVSAYMIYILPSLLSPIKPHLVQYMLRISTELSGIHVCGSHSFSTPLIITYRYHITHPHTPRPQSF